ncbi:MAG TPA: hypothetical protein VFJ02_21150 [Vicinamibacterales bacterium]|nr:hypothetical protein [Vicinamibacterales bacterium]
MKKKEGSMSDDTKILGDINPEPKRARAGSVPKDRESVGEDREAEDELSASGGSNHDRTQHAGSRDVTEGTTGGTGVEVGGVRNLRHGGGATGTDIGNRPE